MVRPHVLSAASTMHEEVPPLSGAGIARGVMLAVGGLLLAVLLVRWTGFVADPPKALIPERPTPVAPPPARVTHQPTVLQADPEASPRVQPILPRTPPADNADGFVGDRELTGGTATVESQLRPSPVREALR